MKNHMTGITTVIWFFFSVTLLHIKGDVITERNDDFKEYIHKY